MATQIVEFADIKRWIDKYESQKYKKGETKSCLLQLSDLRSLIAYIDCENVHLQGGNIIDGVRVYFIRQDTSDQPHLQLLDGETLVYQMSIAIVPTNGYDVDKKGNVIAFNYIKNKEIYAVLPGVKGSEHSGLCPPFCGGQ
jgi:hypothetical protein